MSSPTRAASGGRAGAGTGGSPAGPCGSTRVGGAGSTAVVNSEVRRTCSSIIAVTSGGSQTVAGAAEAAAQRVSTSATPGRRSGSLARQDRTSGARAGGRPARSGSSWTTW